MPKKLPKSAPFEHCFLGGETLFAFLFNKHDDLLRVCSNCEEPAIGGVLNYIDAAGHIPEPVFAEWMIQIFKVELPQLDATCVKISIFLLGEEFLLGAGGNKFV